MMLWPCALCAVDSRAAFSHWTKVSSGLIPQCLVKKFDPDQDFRYDKFPNDLSSKNLLNSRVNDTQTAKSRFVGPTMLQPWRKMEEGNGKRGKNNLLHNFTDDLL